jgi:hypothetical protein
MVRKPRGAPVRKKCVSVYIEPDLGQLEYIGITERLGIDFGAPDDPERPQAFAMGLVYGLSHTK